ncbi:MAG: hypothetical protein D6722_02655 [Bacteroidetes bacterium]|nr:MAG: hypothetical protein D6722_02655 [Bacteroidota bacterium]
MIGSVKWASDNYPSRQWGIWRDMYGRSRLLGAFSYREDTKTPGDRKKEAERKVALEKKFL